MEDSLVPRPMESVSLSVAVKPLPNNLASDDISQSLAESLKGVPMHNKISTSQNNEVLLEFNPEETAVPVSSSTCLTESIPAPLAKTEIEDQVLPPGRNSNQDQVATGPIAATNPTDEDVLLPATRLRRRLADTSDLIVCPGVYDGFSARIALAIGFDALYMVRSLRHRFLHVQLLTIPRQAQVPLRLALASQILVLHS